MHFRLPLFLCLLVVGLPSLCPAQTREPAPTLEPLPGFFDDGPEDVPGSFVPRVALSSANGITTGLVGGLGLYLLAKEARGCDLPGGCESTASLLLPIAVGAWAGSTLTVHYVGGKMDGYGRLPPTMLGGAAGTLLGSVPLVLSGRFGWSFLIPVGATVGAVIGYELSHAALFSEEEEAPRSQAGVRLMPVFASAPGKGIIGGLAGRF